MKEMYTGQDETILVLLFTLLIFSVTRKKTGSYARSMNGYAFPVLWQAGSEAVFQFFAL